eukprot:3190720-Amphidinium_carterae.1
MDYAYADAKEVCKASTVMVVARTSLSVGREESIAVTSCRGGQLVDHPARQEHNCITCQIPCQFPPAQIALPSQNYQVESPTQKVSTVGSSMAMEGFRTERLLVLSQSERKATKLTLGVILLRM